MFRMGMIEYGCSFNGSSLKYLDPYLFADEEVSSILFNGLVPSKLMDTLAYFH